MNIKPYILFRGAFVSAALAAVAFSTGCSKAGAGSSFSAPAIAPIINGALPSTLQPGSHFLASMLDGSLGRFHTITPNNYDDSSKAEPQIAKMFSEWFINGINGSTYQGFLNSLIQGIDSRMAGINTQISGMTTPACLSNAVTSKTFDLHQIDPMLTFTLPYLQCENIFSTGGGNVAGSGSGAAFGTDGKGNYSLWMELNFSGGGTFDHSGGFITVANILNYGSTTASAPESVDGIFMNWDPTNNRITVTRFTASKTTGAFALFMASNSSNTSGGASVSTPTAMQDDSYLGSGLRMLSDGTHIYADGVLYDSNSQNNVGFNECLKASDLSIDTSESADCGTLANTYSTTTWATLYPGQSTNPNPLAVTPALNFSEVTGCTNATSPAAGATVAASPVSSTCGGLTGNEIPGPADTQHQTTPSSTILTALSTLALPSGLTSL